MINIILFPFKVVIWIILLPFKGIIWLVTKSTIILLYIVAGVIMFFIVVALITISGTLIMNPIFWSIIGISTLAFIPIALILGYYNEKSSTSKKQIQTDEIKINNNIISNNKINENETEIETDNEVIICPHCDEQIKKNAIKCKYCKEFI